jgi:membrane-anchored protein YejM (alkaline phosphatase superfamily)
VVCFVSSHLIHLWAEAHFYVPVTSFTRYLPWFSPLRDSRRLVKLGLVDQARAREESMAATLALRPGSELRYPQAPLRCEPRPPLLNVMLIVIDGMRADALAPASAPRLSALAPSAVRFDQHWSGGNVSRPGMFSLFYGLPATYSKVFAEVAQPPVLMDLFRQHGYQLGIFASSPVYNRVVGLDRTALARIPNLRLETISPYPGSSGRDRTLTEEWLAWMDHRDPSRPFFGFLFYNAAVANEPPKDYPPAVPVPAKASVQGQLHARYLTAVHFVDSLVGRVLDDLERHRLLDRTVLVITSDHGIEFDENGLGFDGHGTGFTASQLRTPLLIRWPGRPPGVVSRRTSHFDVAPTLVGGLFGCTNPPSDYASGHDLFTDAPWSWLIATDYTDYALVEPDRITVVLQDAYEIRDASYRLVPHPTLPREGLRAALREMSRFYK